MSLTNFIKQPAIRKKFNTFFPRPKIALSGQIKSPIISKSHPIIGTATDYLIRFTLKHLYKRSKDKEWIAELAANNMVMPKDRKYFVAAKRHYFKYLKNGILTNDLFKSAIDLAKYDIVYRSSGFYYPDDFGKYKSTDIKDLKNIISNVDFQKLKVSKRCLLNPDFGKYTQLIGGADADLIVDNKLIDIKNSRKLQITREMLNQLIGYYFLGKLGKVNGVNKWDTITEIGFYFSRYDILYLFKVDELINKKKRKTFEKWLIRKIRLYNKLIFS